MLQSFLTVGQQILTLYLLLVVGFVLGKVKLLDDRASVALSLSLIHISSSSTSDFSTPSSSPSARAMAR